MTNILILCTGNSCRSQMAHGYFEQMTDGRSVKIFSAGIEAHGLNPRAVAAMKEDGVDISRYTSNTVDEYKGIDFDWVITVCDNANERCPIFPGKAERLHQNFPDPWGAKGSEEEIAAVFRDVRNQIKSFVEKFVAENGLA